MLPCDISAFGRFGVASMRQLCQSCGSLEGTCFFDGSTRYVREALAQYIWYRVPSDTRMTSKDSALSLLCALICKMAWRHVMLCISLLAVSGLNSPAPEHPSSTSIWGLSPRHQVCSAHSPGAARQ